HLYILNNSDSSDNDNDKDGDSINKDDNGLRDTGLKGSKQPIKGQENILLKTLKDNVNSSIANNKRHRTKDLTKEFKKARINIEESISDNIDKPFEHSNRDEPEQVN